MNKAIVRWKFMTPSGWKYRQRTFNSGAAARDFILEKQKTWMPQDLKVTIKPREAKCQSKSEH